MSTRRRWMLAGLGLAGMPAWARQVDLGEAINKAGAQRMLSQRLGKAWLALALPDLEGRARRVLEASLERFERQLEALQRGAPTPEIGASLRRLAQQFTDYRHLLAEPPAPAKVNELLTRAAEVLATAHQATGLLQAQSHAGAAQLVNLAGRQRMLSQRVALLFLADQQGASPALVRPAASEVKADFDAAIERLRSAPETTPGIRVNLDLAQNQWLLLKAALSGGTVGPQAASDVFVASENLLAVMETVTGQFARLLG
jgi:nitrate/nitrite-specific signal transduction histidine kinase